MVTRYIQAQVKAGADAIMIFDSWGGLLTPQGYGEYSLSPLQSIIQDVHSDHEQIPITLFTKGGGMWLEKQKAIRPDCISLDWMTDIAEARRRLGDDIALQGNLDPTALFGSADNVAQMVESICLKHDNKPGHVFNLGHGILPETPVETVHAAIETAHRFS
jgi:uroporphyrinogen decarboxylase